MTDPPKPPASAKPYSRRDDQPKDSAKYLAVVYLADAWDEEAQNRCDAWISHFLLPTMIRSAPGERSAEIERRLWEAVVPALK